MCSSLGLALLSKLGLKEEDVIAMNHATSKRESVYARDQTGLGYTQVAPDFMKASEDAFARLQKAATLSKTDHEGVGKLTLKEARHSVFIPSRLRKRSGRSSSNEDLSGVLASEQPSQVPVEMVANQEEAPDQPRRTRRRHHHVHDHTE